MKYLARFHTGDKTCYWIDIELESSQPHNFQTHPIVANEISRNSKITRVEFFKAETEFTINLEK